MERRSVPSLARPSRGLVPILSATLVLAAAAGAPEARAERQVPAQAGPPGPVSPVIAARRHAPVIAPPAREGASATRLAQNSGKKRQRRVLLVGPKRGLKVPSAAARVAQRGDHIKIDAGVYRDCAVWTTSNLIIEGVGNGFAHMTDAVCEDQAIWLIRGSSIQVRRIKFSNATSSHKNGAGIKMLGDNLYVLDSMFVRNDNGILAGYRPNSTVFVSKSRFERNGKCQPVCAHGIYVGQARRLRIVGSVFEATQEGHHIKSRASLTEIIGNRLLDGAEGTASLSINLPNGGTAVIQNNFIEQGPLAPNYRAMISIGEEIDPKKPGKEANPSRGMIFENNIFVNSHPSGTVFIRNRTKTPVTLRNNRFTGKGSQTSGPRKL